MQRVTEMPRTLEDTMRKYIPSDFIVITKLPIKFAEYRQQKHAVSQHSQFHGNYVYVTTNELSYKTNRFCKWIVVINVKSNRILAKRCGNARMVFDNEEFILYNRTSEFEFIDSPVCDIMIKMQGADAGKQYPSDRTKTKGYYYICATEPAFNAIRSKDITQAVEKIDNFVVTLSKQNIIEYIWY